MFTKIFLPLIVIFSCAAEYAWVNTTNGLIKGKVQQTVDGTFYEAFMGIPYAEPPIRQLRFQPPVPKKPWDKQFWDATFERGCCFQIGSPANQGSENCLHINVFTPANRSANTALPVMFFIYGGGFTAGCAQRINYGPDHLMEHGVILVTFNYRVGAFGFMTTGDTVVPGNARLKDQVLALEWVHQNIKLFGGNPNKVTVFGQSAGAASVTYLSINPKAKGLYRGAIAESGSFMDVWAVQKKTKELYQQLAATVDKRFSNDSVSSKELLQFLQSVPARALHNASNVVNAQIYPSFVPTIEVEHEGAAITKPLYEVLQNGTGVNTVPLLMGFNSEEANYMLDEPDSVKTYAAAFDQYPTGMVPESMNVKSEQNRKMAGELIKNIYVGNENFSANLKKCINYFSDNTFTRAIIKHAQLQSRLGTVYFYRFAFHGVLGGNSKTSVGGFSEEVRHGEELSYVLTRSYGGLNTTDLSKYPEMDRLVHRRFITLLTNFVKYLNPTPEKSALFQSIIWPKFDAEKAEYLDIGSELELKLHPKKSSIETWDLIYSKYGTRPFYTY